MSKSHRNRRAEKADWSYLPIELLSEIATRLDDRITVLTFRSVCRSWRAAAPYPALPNGAILSPILPFKNPDTRCRYFTTTHIYIIEPAIDTPGYSRRTAKFWLVMLDEINPGRLYLRDPLSRFPIEKWPAKFPKMLSFYNLRVVEIARSFNLTNALPRPIGCEYWNNDHVERVLMFENCGPRGGSTFAVLGYQGFLDLYRTGDGEWTRVYYFATPLKLEDIVSQKGKICGVDRKGRAYVVDPESGVANMILYEHIRVSYRRKRLVESDGDIYMVQMHKEIDDMRVFRMDEKRHRWAKLHGLGDLGLFVGSDCSFALSSKQCGGFQGNCVYVFKNGFRGYHGEDDNHKNIILHRRSCNFQIGVFRFDGRGSVGKANSYNFLWPPPVWLYKS